MGMPGGIGGSGGSGVKKLSQPFKPFDVKKKFGSSTKPVIGSSIGGMANAYNQPSNNIDESNNNVDDSSNNFQPPIGGG